VNPQVKFERPPGSILVVVTRRIGDVFLSGALIRSLHSAWPQSRIDLLVFAGTEGVAQTHPDVSSILTVPVHSGWTENLALARRLWKRYDLAVSTAPSDRPTLYALCAGRRSIGVMADGAKHAWKTGLLSATVPFDDRATHTVVQNLMLADALGVPRVYELPVRWREADERQLTTLVPDFGARRHAVLHVYPKFPYKMWSHEGWSALVRWLLDRGFSVVVSGGPDPEERGYVDSLLAELEGRVVDLAGKLNFAQLAALFALAAVYVGPDTATTHLAAATGVPTVALFGPSNPVKWGPWPRGWSTAPSPYASRGTQFRGNVALVQGEGHCVPCLEEGCARTVESESACLQMLPARRVIDAIEQLWRDHAR
jgi:heptosyltransferase-3